MPSSDGSTAPGFLSRVGGPVAGSGFAGDVSPSPWEDGVRITEDQKSTPPGPAALNFERRRRQAG